MFASVNDIILCLDLHRRPEKYVYSVLYGLCGVLTALIFVTSWTVPHDSRWPRGGCCSSFPWCGAHTF